MSTIVVERVAAPTIEVIAPGPYVAEIFLVVGVGPAGPPGPAYYEDGVSQVVASGSVDPGGWYLPPSLRADLNLTRIHAQVISGTSGEFSVTIKRNTTILWGPEIIEQGTPLTETVDLEFDAGDAVVAEIGDIVAVTAFVVQLSGVYS